MLKTVIEPEVRGKMSRLGRFMGAVPCLFLILAFSNCRNRDASGIHRLIDHLKADGVAASPMADLGRHFPITRQICRSGEFRKISLEGHDYLAAATTAPVACPFDHDVPPGLAVIRNGKEIPMSPAPLEKVPSWRWLKGETGIDFSKTARRLNGFKSLQAGQSAQQAVLLPAGQALFELSARVADEAPFLACLNVEIGKKVQEIWIGADRLYKFAERVEMGRNRIRVTAVRFVPKNPAAPAAGNPVVEIRSFRVRPSADLILISPPSGTKSLDGEFEFRYPAEPMDRIIPVEKILADGESLTQNLNAAVAAGQRMEILFQPSSAAGTLSLRVGEGKPVETEIRSGEGGSFVFESGASGKSSELKAAFRGRPESGKKAASSSGLRINSIIVEKPDRTLWLPLYRFSDFRIKARGIGENPFGIKKKIQIGEESLNSVFAPPRSLLRLDVRVPENGVLHFGYGIPAGENDWGEKRSVLFELVVEESGKKDVVFSACLDPSLRPEDAGIHDREVDMSAYTGRKARLWFRTVAGPEGKEENEMGGSAAPAVWINPYIYKKERISPGKTAPDHIILVSLDTLRADHLGCYGYPLPTSPALDELSRDGVLFRNAFCPSPYTLASHMSIFTGLSPAGHRVFYLDQKLGPEVRTLTELLRSAGYHTAGLTDGGLIGENFGFAKGFDIYQEISGGDNLIDSAGPLFSKASDYLDRHKNHKFFLFLHTYQVHNPYDSPEPQGEMFLKSGHPWKGISLESICGAGFRGLFKEVSDLERENVSALYDGEIRYTDDALIKPLVEKLKTLGLYDRTLIVVMSDHGEAFREHGYWMHSWNIYNETARVPLIVKLPGGRHRGRTIEDYVGLVDVLPTVLDEADISSRGFELDGESLRDLMVKGGRKPKTYLIFQPAAMTAAPTPRRVGIVRDPYKLIINDPYPEEAYRWFSPPPPEHRRIELYDLRRDPGEKRNIAAMNKNVVADLMREAEILLKDLGPENAGAKSVMNEALKERLKTLGYIE